MIYLIKYKRAIGNNVYDKTSTFITKETNDCQAYHKWIMQHTTSFMKSIQLISIAEKYPPDTLADKRQRLGMFISTPDNA